MKVIITISFLIPIIFIAGAELMMSSLWNYPLGNQVGFILFYGTMIWSVPHIVIITVKPQLKNKLIWLISTSIPILYFLLMVISGKD